MMNYSEKYNEMAQVAMAEGRKIWNDGRHAWNCNDGYWEPVFTEEEKAELKAYKEQCEEIARAEWEAKRAKRAKKTEAQKEQAKRTRYAREIREMEKEVEELLRKIEYRKKYLAK